MALAIKHIKLATSKDGISLNEQDPTRDHARHVMGRH